MNKAVPPEEFGRAIHDFATGHLVSHDPAGVRAAIIVVANETGTHTNKDGTEVPSFHICQFGGGDPELLAEVLLSAIDDMQNSNPEFREALMRITAQRMMASIKDGLEKVKLAAEAGDATKELLEKVKAMPTGTPGDSA